MSVRKRLLLNVNGGGVKKNHIILNQNLTDPAKIISGDINSEAIQWIRANSHRYLGKYTGEGQMTICQLSDDNNGGKTDAVYFADTNYTYIDNVENDSRCDWFMRLPKFYYHAEEVSLDIWDIGFGQEPEADDWKCWDGNDLIGCFKALARDSLLLSIRHVTPTVRDPQSYFKSYAQARGTGYSLVKFKHHSMLAFLFYAMYGNTDSQAICGRGSTTDRRQTGYTDILGMMDSSYPGYEGYVNFWGLENWWGDIDELVDNVSINNRLWTITEDDGTTRDVQPVTSNGYISKFSVGEHLDLVPVAVGASDSAGFCDRFIQMSGNLHVLGRSSYSSDLDGGVAFADATHATLSLSGSCGSRLAFRGDIIVENDVPTFRSIPITNDGYSGTTSP